ncbi:MAG TPA: AmmeMemoRadiSam system radical SAM enzyme [Firmicutes bacterium]|nr:AmmeMemoRadiSam system radical SAM enzyme [Bacillota bacterium]
MKEALYWHKLEGDRVQCELCPQDCRIAPGRAGACRVRRNKAGVLYATNYARVSSVALDPVEKKPLYHFYPGRTVLSLGTIGCNLKCSFCQNWEIAQEDAPTRGLGPEQAVALARREGGGCIGIAYTYSEPLMWYEYVLDTARPAREAGLKNVLVTNGFIQPEPLEALLPLIDALNIDVKAFTGDYYRRVCHGGLEPVLKTVETAVRAGCHVELTTLLVPGLNDAPDEIRSLVSWIAGLAPTIPLHLTRYYPQYKMELPPTPLATLERAWEIAREKLAYVYIGNALTEKGQNTYCPGCGALLIERRGFSARPTGLEHRRCRACGRVTEVTC